MQVESFSRFVKVIEIIDKYTGEPYTGDWRCDYIGLEGEIILMDNNPVKKPFLYFFPYTKNETTPWAYTNMNTSRGDLKFDEKGDIIFETRHSIYRYSEKNIKHSKEEITDFRRRLLKVLMV